MIIFLELQEVDVDVYDGNSDADIASNEEASEENENQIVSSMCQNCIDMRKYADKAIVVHLLFFCSAG